MIINRDLIGKKFENSSFGNFDKIAGTEVAIDVCKKFVAGSSDGIILIGAQGRGKTHLLIATIKECDKRQLVEIDELQRAVIQEPGNRILFWPNKELASKLRAEAISSNREESSACKRADLLAIDDFASEKPTEFIIEAMEEILDWRYRNEMKTLITTNLSLAAIGQIYGPRIPSRWIEQYDIVKITTKEDYRLKLARERNG